MRDDEECRCYVNHLVAEHRRLDAQLRKMRGAITQSVGPDEEPSFAEVARNVQRLRDQLDHHFTEEEGGGCLDEAVSRCPRLSAEVKRIKEEHADLLASADHLIQRAKTLLPNLLNQFALELEFEKLYQRLRMHEAAENQVLAQGLGMPVNGEETDRQSIASTAV
jgi:hypothetical protein